MQAENVISSKIEQKNCLPSIYSKHLQHVNLTGITILDNLHGYWALQRNLDQWGAMWGNAVFIKVNQVFCIYQESGHVYLHHTKKHYKAFTSQLYTYHHQTLSIYTYHPFNHHTGILLHTFKLPTDKLYHSPICLNSEYSCHKDIYQLDWIFINSHVLQLNYAVQGPNKSYKIQTNLFKKIKSGV